MNTLFTRRRPTATLCRRSHHRQNLVEVIIVGISLESSSLESCQNIVRSATAVAVVTNWMTTRSMDSSPTTMPPTIGSMASSVATIPNPSIDTNYVNVDLSIDKLDGTNEN